VRPETLRPRVIIFSVDQDEHARYVARLLCDRGVPFVVIDTGQFPQGLALGFEPADLPRVRVCRAGGQDVGFEDVRSIWLRRPRSPGAGAQVVDRSIRAFVARESEQALMGLWLGLGSLLWVNPPSKDRDAHTKPYQLAMARRVGLSTPKTLVTNDPQAAAAFIEELTPERTVYKVFTSDSVCWRETRRLRRDELGYLGQLRLAPAIFQEQVDGMLDVRVTVVGSCVFAASIDASRTSYPQDYRIDLEHADVRAHRLPEETADRLLQVCRELALVYAAADFRVTPSGEYVFLELNPAGQWLFIEQSTGLPIGAALADLLSGCEQG